MTSSETALPNVAEQIGALLARVPEADRPLLVAAAERLAAERYRGWAERVASPALRASLLACADREEEIATRVESLHPRAAERQRALLDANPDLAEVNRTIFAGRPLEQQFAIQAKGERAGAGLWRALAQRAQDAQARDTYLACARLEEASAEVLEAAPPPVAQREASDGAIRGARYVHTNLIARDWRALARFYQDVFGCTPVPPERDLSGPDLAAGTGLAGAHLQGAHLRLPGHGDDGPTLEIFQYAEQQPAGTRAVNRPGLTHLAFAVPSVDTARARVLVAGGAAVGEVVCTKIATGAVATWCYVRDPEGNILELQSWSTRAA